MGWAEETRVKPVGVHAYSSLNPVFPPLTIGNPSPHEGRWNQRLTGGRAPHGRPEPELQMSFLNAA